MILRDITERKQAEDRFRLAVESAPNAMVMVNQKGEIILVNSQSEHLFGYSREELIGQLMEVLVPPRFRSWHPEYRADFSSHPQTRAMGAGRDLYGLRKDGREIPIEIGLNPIEMGGQVVVLSSIVDITERKLVEETLRQQARLIELSYEPIIIWEMTGGVVEWNKGAERLYGYSKAEAIGKETHQLLRTIHPVPLGEFLRTLETKGEWTGELGHTTKAGNAVTVESRHQLFESSGRKLVLETNRDISERKRAEDRLKEQAALLDHAQDAIIVRDLEHRILFWNKRAERVYGWTAAEALGQDARQLLHQQNPARFDEADRLVIEHGEWMGELHPVTKDGRTITIECRWTLVRDEQGQPKSILVINTDITEKKKIEAQFLRAQRMESLGTLAGGIAHDLNNLLSPIMTAVQLLQTRLPDESSQRLLQILQTNTERGGAMVKQVLSFARGVQGERVMLQPTHLIREVVKILKETFPKSINVHLQIGEGVWEVMGDATQLHQVLMNLCVFSLQIAD